MRRPTLRLAQHVADAPELQTTMEAHLDKLNHQETTMNRRTMLTLSTLALLCVAVSGSHALAQQQQKIIEQTQYWALPGTAEEVYQQRMHACDVREKLGLPRGQVLRRQVADMSGLRPRQGDSEALPDVIWQIEYQNDAERIRDLKVREAPEFEEVRKHMGTLTRRFERGFWLPN